MKLPHQLREKMLDEFQLVRSGNSSGKLQMLELKNEIQSKVSYDLSKQQKEYFLNQQMKQIQQELGGDPVEQEINELRKKAKSKKWGKEVAEAKNPGGAEGAFSSPFPARPEYGGQ